MNSKATAKNALFIGTICSVAYLAVYIARNVLSAVSPQMISDGVFSEEIIGTMSSVFFFAYAVGSIGWGGLILVWLALMVIGVIISIPYKKRCEG